MSAVADMLRFDADQVAERSFYKLLTATAIPRPIALVTSLDAGGALNAAPFSFFNVLSFDPPVLALGLESRSGGLKDTAANIRTRGHFVVNTVSYAMAEQMNLCAGDYGAEIDEVALAGFTTTQSTHIDVPRLAEAPAAMECRRYMTLEFGRARNIVLGEILSLHLDRAAVDPERYHVDPGRLDLIGRLGGSGYVRLSDRFDMARPPSDTAAAPKRA